MNVALWVLRVLLALQLATAGLSKVMLLPAGLLVVDALVAAGRGPGLWPAEPGTEPYRE
jgi:uncharacterized membrane protein YphA (DoxX/SURF4 family)